MRLQFLTNARVLYDTSRDNSLAVLLRQVCFDHFVNCFKLNLHKKILFPLVHVSLTETFSVYSGSSNILLNVNVRRNS